MTETTLEVLHVPDCPNLPVLLDRLAQVADVPIITREVATEAEAVGRGMSGSPTLLVNGVDPFAGAGAGDFGMSCRLYRDENGQVVPAPSVDQLRDGISAAAAATAELGRGRDILSAWRTTTTPLEPGERAVHQAVLRHFARTGHSPSLEDLEPAAAGSDRTTREALAALHEADAIRLSADAEIAVAYPFSATPTRHRVRIGGGPDVYAMCAIDALGMSAMLGEDTLIESVDPVTGETITVTTTTAGHSTWAPAAAVVFVGASTACGPSVDCCCDYLNFFAGRTSAETWIARHADIPGEILAQPEAENLAVCLFGQLLATTATPGLWPLSGDASRDARSTYADMEEGAR